MLWQASGRHPDDMLESWCGKASKKPQTVWACASRAMVTQGWATAFLASPFCVRAIWKTFTLLGQVWVKRPAETQMLCLKLEVARQAQSPSHSWSVNAVPLEVVRLHDKALKNSGCVLSVSARTARDQQPHRLTWHVIWVRIGQK